MSANYHGLWSHKYMHPRDKQWQHEAYNWHWWTDKTPTTHTLTMSIISHIRVQSIHKAIVNESASIRSCINQCLDSQHVYGTNEKEKPSLLLPNTESTLESSIQLWSLYKYSIIECNVCPDDKSQEGRSKRNNPSPHCLQCVCPNTSLALYAVVPPGSRTGWRTPGLWATLLNSMSSLQINCSAGWDNLALSYIPRWRRPRASS